MGYIGLQKKLEKELGPRYNVNKIDYYIKARLENKWNFMNEEVQGLARTVICFLYVYTWFSKNLIINWYK